MQAKKQPTSLKLFISLLILSLYTHYCEAKTVAAPTNVYYKSQLPLQRQIAVIATDWDNVVVKRKPVAIKPIESTIALYNKLNLPVVVWTNNKFCNYHSKLKTSNKYMAIHPQAAFTVEKHGNKDRPSDAYSNVKKPHEAYYKKAYEYTRKVLHLKKDDIVVFIDDLAENINAARAAARKYNLPIIAIQYTTAKQLQHDINVLMPRMQLSYTFEMPAFL